MKLLLIILLTVLLSTLTVSIGYDWPLAGTLLFVSADLFFVLLIATLPTAFFLFQACHPAPLLRRGLTGLCLFILLGLLLPMQWNEPSDISFQALLLIRFACSITISFLLVQCYLSFSSPQPEISTAPQPASKAGLSLLAVMLIGGVAGGTYHLFQDRFYDKQLSEAMEQGRHEKARTLTTRWLRLSPAALWNDQPVHQLQRQLTAHCQQLRQDLAQASNPRTMAERGLLIQAYLSLDEFSTAENLLQPLLTGEQESPLAWDTLGLLTQRQLQWQPSLQAYQRAAHLWQQQSRSSTDDPSLLSTEQQTGLASAYRGIAFAQRELGQMQQAAATYQQLIALAPTAENHFLLARFYEDAQQTQLAEHHARQAAILDPEHYQSPAHQLLQQMRSAHFGCFRVQ